MYKLDDIKFLKEPTSQSINHEYKLGLNESEILVLRGNQTKITLFVGECPNLSYAVHPFHTQIVSISKIRNLTKIHFK